MGTKEHLLIDTCSLLTCGLRQLWGSLLLFQFTPQLPHFIFLAMRRKLVVGNFFFFFFAFRKDTYIWRPLKRQQFVAVATSMLLRWCLGLSLIWLWIQSRICSFKKTLLYLMFFKTWEDFKNRMPCFIFFFSLNALNLSQSGSMCWFGMYPEKLKST